MNQKSQNTPAPNSPNLEQIIAALSKITSCSPEKIEPHLTELIARLNQEKNDDLASTSFYATSTHEEWSAEFHNWLDSHKGKDIPVLSKSQANYRILELP